MTFPQQVDVSVLLVFSTFALFTSTTRSMSQRDSTYYSEGQAPGGDENSDSSDDGLGSSMHLPPSFVCTLKLEEVFCYLYPDVWFWSMPSRNYL